MPYGQLPTIKADDGTEYQGFKIKVPNPPKVAFVTLPTTAQMMLRLNAQKTVRHSLGRGKSETRAVQNQEADLKLFKTIRLDANGPEFDMHEAAMVIGKLTYCEATETARSGEEFMVTVDTPFGEVMHTVRMPFQPEIHAYRSAALSEMEMRHGQTEYRFKPDVAVTLYKQIAKAIEGYVDTISLSDVPPHHMIAVVSEVVSRMDDIDPLMDPNS